MSPQLSPDGRSVSFLAPFDGVLNVWVAPADRPGDAVPVTRDRTRGIQISKSLSRVHTSVEARAGPWHGDGKASEAAAYLAGAEE